MIQFGSNAGPRHLRIFGHVRNIKKQMSDSDKFVKDRRILGVFGLVWNILKATLPQEVMGHCEAKMKVEGMPQMGTAEDRDGMFCFDSC
jgi:hypothetical protein